MACYICANEGVTTADRGDCQKCGQHACGRPPLRRDRQFHGDECAVSSCGLFFCERHMHTHPDQGHGVSSAFPAMALAIGIEAIAATAPLDDVANPEATLQSEPYTVHALNRFMTCVSPGAAALYEERTSLPSGTFDVRTRPTLLDGARDNVVLFRPSFFKREVLATISRMALRTVWLAGTTLGVHLSAGTANRFHAWVGNLGSAAVEPGLLVPMIDHTWIVQVVHALPARDWPLYADLSELPDEQDAHALVKLLARRFDEGTSMRASVAEA